MPRTRPKSVPNADVLSTGSSDSGLETDNLCIYPGIGNDVNKSPDINLPEFQFGEAKPHKERMNNLKSALDWVRNELKEMKSQDKHLARTMIDLRSRIQQMKLELEANQDIGYDSDEGESSDSREKSTASSPTSLSEYNYFVNGTDFEKNKRATWAI